MLISSDVTVPLLFNQQLSCGRSEWK